MKKQVKEFKIDVAVCKKKELKVSTSTTPIPATFKARQMPNFKSIHNKLPPTARMSTTPSLPTSHKLENKVLSSGKHQRPGNY